MPDGTSGNQSLQAYLALFIGSVPILPEGSLAQR